MTERELIEGCLRGDRAAEEELFRRYSGKMLAVCRRYARHEMEAEDLLQEAFVRVYANLGQFRFQGSFEGWIRRIVVHTVLKHFRKLSIQREQIGIPEHADEDSVDPAALHQLHEEELLKLIAALPDGYRVVFNLYAIEGYSHKEIAEMLGIGESTSRSQFLKARKALQAQLRKLLSIFV